MHHRAPNQDETDFTAELNLQSARLSPANNIMTDLQNKTEHEPALRRFSWRNIVTMAGLIVLGITPWAQAQQSPPDLPAYCPPLTAFTTPSLFDVFWGTTTIRFPYQ